MARLVLSLAVLSGVFSVYAFNNGNVPIGMLFAAVAVLPFAFLVGVALSRRRKGTVPAGQSAPHSGPMAGQPGGAAAPSARSKQQTIILRVVVVAVLASIGYGVYWVLFEPKANDKALTSVRDIEPGCYGNMGRKYFPQTADYLGSGPHPIALFITNSADSTSAASLGSGAPAHWNGDRLDPRQVQLIACLDKPADGEFLADCRFSSSTLPQYRGVYDVTVYEAKTGKKVGSDQIRGKGQASCPGMVMTKGKSPKIHTEPDFAEYQQVLSKYVDR